MIAEFHPEAETEFFEAIDYYEQTEPGLGPVFAAEVASAIEQIIHYPFAWRVLERDVRRCLMRRFPYGLLYACETERIWIVAVMHLRRHPVYWKSRLP